jgi:spore maturation protein CgeB
MTHRPLSIVVLGLSLSSSWGNGHATTWRGLLKSFAARGHRILFLERDVPWYAQNRDLAHPAYCDLRFYRSVEELRDVWAPAITAADAVIIGSFVPDGVDVGRLVQASAGGTVAFYDIDTPVTLGKLLAGDHEYIAPDLIPRFDLYLSFTGGPLLDRLRESYGARVVAPLWCSVDPDAYRPIAADKRWDLSYLGTYSEDRQPTLHRLLVEVARQAPDLSFVVAGPQYPDTIEWPANVQRLEHVAPAEHAAFYCSSRFTLNVTRREMIAAGFSPSVRLFEAAACGVPIISDVWNGIDTFFAQNEEIFLADDPSAVLGVLRNPDSGPRMGLAARARVLASHTSARRAEELERLLESVR